MMWNNKNQNSPKLSVVVIAFNNELYIEEALESLHEQTFDDMEVVVVNDFSSDRTGELIDSFIEGKPKFKAIHLKENSGGCSTPRNTGIANSTGEYIMFLDGDDWYTINACEKMVAGIERTGSDFVAGQVIRTNNYEIWYHKQIYSMERTNINIREFSMLLFDSLSVNKIYKRSFLDRHKLRFPEGIHYEDIVFTGKAYFLADSVSIIPEPVYYWRVVENAAVKSITNRRFDFDNFKNRITAHRMFDQFLREHGDILYLDHKNNKFLRHDLKLYTNDYLLFDDDYKEQFHQLIYDYLHEVMDEYAFLKLPQKERVMYYLLFLGDREAFQDYVAYVNGLPTKTNRVYCIGSTYYFRASILRKKNEKFLKIEKPEILYTIHDIQLETNKFSFRPKVTIESINPNEITSFWILRNRQTGEEIQSDNSNGERVSFQLDSVTFGNYYLSLYVYHQGNIHKELVKSSEIDELSNKKVEDGKVSKAIFINHKNSFAIKVQPLKKLDQISWAFFRRKKSMDEKQQGTVSAALGSYVKKMIKKLPVRPNWVLFESHMGKQYSDSPKYIYEEMLKMGKKYKYIWSYENPELIEMPGPAIKVKKHSLRHFYYMNRSKYWVDNQGIAHLVKKKKEQTYVQTWHGTPLKRMGYDQKTLPTDWELSRLRLQTDSWDYFVSPNPYSTEIFRRAFRYGGEILETGYPRNDVLIQQPKDIAKKTRGFFNISQDRRVILFAPTFRDWDPNSFQKTLADILALSKKLDENTVVLLRLHYLLSDRISRLGLPSNIINASSYQDIQELFLISDVLITDYSSVMFDYALLKRPIILYTYDLVEYVTRRGTYFDLESRAPGPVCQTIDEVIAYLDEPKRLRDYDKALENFALQFGSIEDGKAARKVIDEVFE
ncbi:bifunctional glycosyltransferase family 2 protein/CDP-glycerol:glycerophosphate glycerophosphotransferase [Cytobacillus firmus]|uniref:bifunctional glycosyltransferase/CDP-glycerol:glycerophosphate glycerophosphotransferase n=1 Tax=Cytobacillus firmus TaxID=1399 RepID=UPI001CFEC7DE|nr:bifunctional glycosyltransferase family 2 protein/CDP-glycerol:glycerophosphate glycerophosphotransferase [Cytobacillus firmus]